MTRSLTVARSDGKFIFGRPQAARCRDGSSSTRSRGGRIRCIPNPTNFWPANRWYNGSISIEEIEAEALKLDPKARARLAERLLKSLEALSDEENERLWAEEAERRDTDWNATPDAGRPATDVLRDARAKLE